MAEVLGRHVGLDEVIARVPGHFSSVFGRELAMEEAR
jgi:hypothetical protein